MMSGRKGGSVVWRGERGGGALGSEEEAEVPRRGPNGVERRRGRGFRGAGSSVWMGVAVSTLRDVSGRDQLRQLYVLPHRHRSCRASLAVSPDHGIPTPVHPVLALTLRHQANQSWH